MNHQTKLITLSLIFLVSTLSHASSQSVPQLAKKALAATVSLEMQDENSITIGRGSGFFVRENLIATNFHVIEGATHGSAKLVNTDTAYPIKGVTATDEPNDLALLEVIVHGVIPLLIGESDKVQVGDTIYVAGNPLGFEGTFSDGIISGRRDSATKKERLQMTAPISPGSSGGPVLNQQGEVIGVSVSAYNPLYGQNLNFAIPSNALMTLLARSGRANPLSHGKPSKSAFTYWLRGWDKYELEDYEGAIMEFTHVIRLDPKDAFAYIGRGMAKEKLGPHLPAITDYDTAIRLNPNFALAYDIRGVAKRRLGQFFAAIAIAIRLAPDNASAYHSRGDVKGKLGQYSAAIADYDIAIRLDPNDALAYVTRGLLKRKLGEHSAAIADFDVAIHLDPDNATAYRCRGGAKRRLGEHSAAILDYDIVIGLAPNYALAYYNRALAWNKLHRSHKARADLKTALRLATRADNQSLIASIEKELRQLQQ